MGLVARIIGAENLSAKEFETLFGKLSDNKVSFRCIDTDTNVTTDFKFVRKEGVKGKVKDFIVVDAIDKPPEGEDPLALTVAVRQYTKKEIADLEAEAQLIEERMDTAEFRKLPERKQKPVEKKADAAAVAADGAEAQKPADEAEKMKGKKK